MLGLQMLGKGRIRVKEYPDPVAKDSLVVVEIRSSAICGSEMHGYRGEKELEANGGHEASGIVRQVDRAKYVKVGDRVVLYAQSRCGRCRHCLSGQWVQCESPTKPPRTPGNHCQYVLLDEELCMPLPDDISFDVGALLGDGLGTPYHAIKRLGVSAFDRVVVCGQGPIGLGATMICKFLGAVVIAVEMTDYRIDLAKKMGADHVLNPKETDALKAIKDITGGGMADVALDCSGTEAGENLALDSLKRRGRMAFVGENQRATINPSAQLIRKELEVIGSWYFNASEHEELVNLVRRGAPVEKLITHRFPLKDAERAFEVFSKGQAGKVILYP